VLRQLRPGTAVFEAITVDEATALGSDVRWVDALNATDAEQSDLERVFGSSDFVVRWLHDPSRSPRARVLDGVLTFGVPVPIVDQTAGGAPPTIIVIGTEQRTFTAHDEALERFIDDVARNSGGWIGSEGHTPAMGLIDELIDRYERVVDRIADDQLAHGTELLRFSDGRQSATDVVADSLRTATDISRVQGDVRRVRQALTGLRRLVSERDTSAPVPAGAFDASTHALDALEADIEYLDHRLEVIADARMSILSSRQNETSKKIGAWAGVFAVNAVITGWYGMNIDAGLPGAGSWVPVSVILGAATAALIVLFRRIDWL
jgi:magnesium transporter